MEEDVVEVDDEILIEDVIKTDIVCEENEATRALLGSVNTSLSKRQLKRLKKRQVFLDRLPAKRYVWCNVLSQ